MSLIQRFAGFFFGLLLAATLAACGGGGSSTSSPTGSSSSSSSSGGSSSGASSSSSSSSGGTSSSSSGGTSSSGSSSGGSSSSSSGGSSSGGGSSPDALLAGQYAFVVSGFDSALAGSVTLDGNGNVTGGTEDIRAPATTLTGSDLSITSGTYTVGTDHRGTLSYTDSNGNKFTFALALGGISNGVASQGQMIEFDSNPLEMTGSMALQTKADFSASVFSGAYAFQSSGWDTTPQPDVTVGSFTAGAGAVTNGLFDQNDSGSVTASTAFTGSFGTVDANGRGTFTVTTGSGSNTYEIYVVSAGQFLMINDTSNPDVQSGEVLQQTGGPFSTSSLSGATIFESRSEDGLPAPNVTFGLITFISGGSFSGSIDQDDSGSVTLSQSIGGGTWSLASASNGRFLLTPPGGHIVVGYLVAPNFAFMTTESAVIPDVSTIEPQTGGPFSNGSLNGSFYLGTLPSNSPGAPSRVGGQPAPAFNIDSGVVSLNGSGGCSFTLDINSSGVPSSGLTGSDTCSVAANGRITSASGDFVGWIVSPTKFYFLGITQGQPATPNPVLWTVQQ